MASVPNVSNNVHLDKHQAIHTLACTSRPVPWQCTPGPYKHQAVRTLACTSRPEHGSKNFQKPNSGSPKERDNALLVPGELIRAMEHGHAARGDEAALLCNLERMCHTGRDRRRA